MRMRNDPNAILEIVKREQYVIEPNPIEKLEFKRVFGNCEPVFLELGMGKGQFLTQMASKYIQNNYIGVELKKEVLACALKKIEAGQMSNCKVMWQNIQWIEAWFMAQSISGIYLNFSDPWPKKRHAKRRLTHPEFLEKYAKILVPEGFIQLRTDNEGLFEYSLNTFLSEGYPVRKVRLNWHQHEASIGEPRTEYEEKFSKKGYPIYQLEARLP